MRAKGKILILSALLSVSLLSACNTDNNKFNEQEEIDYRPVRYDNNTDLNDDNQVKKPYIHDENPDETNEGMQKGYDLEFNKNRGAE
ncbi:hypothetical protein [Lederbergia lenta]|uniref:hypothetical protein n=1 Tax=Lederbergia lenta TaxID=1467 RepID=UPI00203EBA72|nr:hypothetical protein [Lederbergia lenta]MCM3112376.1 hypothetical protein [Lederbergia lenta]